uniref:DM2 domain-containing protein n=1 Tax=Quercus lobata TaxID=97700 RepID=A0A7N2M8N6_QUELO
MVTDQEISEAIESLFNNNVKEEGDENDNSLSSLNGVVRKLESKLGVDLSHKLDFIRAQIHFLFQPQQQQQHHQQQYQQRLPHQHHQQQQQQHQHQQPKDHFALHQNPNYHPAPPSSSAFQIFSAPPPQNHAEVAVAQPPPLAVSFGKLSKMLCLPHSIVVLKTNPTPSDLVSVPLVVKSGSLHLSASPKTTKRKGGPGGLNKLCGVSPELQTIVGQPALPRTEIVKQLWAYIRKHNLQDPSNKRKIICNDELRLVFETDCTDMFKMNKLLAKHIIPLEPSKQSGSKKAKVDVESAMRSSDPGPSVIISEALANFFGVGEREMLQSEVLRRIWEYIKLCNLEDPVTPMEILCDAKLQELFGCESISALGIPEVLENHHIIRK